MRKKLMNKNFNQEKQGLQIFRIVSFNYFIQNTEMGCLNSKMKTHRMNKTLTIQNRKAEDTGLYYESSHTFTSFPQKEQKYDMHSGNGEGGLSAERKRENIKEKYKISQTNLPKIPDIQVHCYETLLLHNPQKITSNELENKQQ